MNKAHIGNAHALRESELASAIQMLASIHAGIPGQCIPREVMDFYKAMKNGDAFRPAILKQVVLTLNRHVLAGTSDRTSLKAAVRDRLETVAGRQSDDRLEQWLLADVQRERLLPSGKDNWIDRLRAGYVAEGMEMFEDTMDYAIALASEGM